MVKDAIVIGAGIIGATISAALQSEGLDVVTVDDGRSMSGTKPSGGHLKPSWFGGLPKSEYVPALDMLDKLWGLISEEFVIRPMGTTTTIYRVDTAAVIQHPRTVRSVARLGFLDNYPLVKYSDGEEDRTRLLVIATGAWAPELVPETTVQAKRGVSFRFSGKLDSPFISPWAPFKQIVAHQQSEKEIWVGDGSAILADNWTDQRTEQCRNRCERAIGGGGSLLRTLTGNRSYTTPLAKGEPCLFRRLGRRAWLVTGAGKSGTIAAGWAALRILREVKKETPAD